MINYYVGDVFEEIKNIKNKTIIIPHVCNDVGGWGAGFVVPLGKNFPESKERYIKLSKEGDIPLGYTQLVYCENECNIVVVCNMIAQHGTVGPNNSKPIKYGALAECLNRIKILCLYKENPEIHTCAFDSALAGGNWGIIATLLEEIIPDEIPIHIYSLKNEDQMKIIKQVTVVDVCHQQKKTIRNLQAENTALHNKIDELYDVGMKKCDGVDNSSW